MKIRRVARVMKDGVISYASPHRDSELQLVLLRGPSIGALEPTGELIKVSAVTFLPPIEPTKLIGIGANFPDDASREGPERYPSFFLMAPSAMVGHLGTVTLPPVFGSVVAEGELGVVIRSRSRNLSAEAAPSAILGYTIVNDLSGRDSLLESVPVAVKKSADGFAPIGPFIHLDATLRDFQIRTERNNDVVQRGRTMDMLHGIVECLCYISRIMTLEPFDVVAMGSPSPKPKLVAGDRVTVTISEIGTLESRIAASAESL